MAGKNNNRDMKKQKRRDTCRTYLRPVDDVDKDLCKMIVDEIKLDEGFWSHFDVVTHAWGGHQYKERIMHAGCLWSKPETSFAITPINLGPVREQRNAEATGISRAPPGMYSLMRCIIEKNKDKLQSVLPEPLWNGMWTQVSIQKHWGDGTSDTQNKDHRHVDYGIFYIVLYCIILYYIILCYVHRSQHSGDQRS